MGLLRHPLAVPQCFTASRADGGGFDASDAVWVEDKGTSSAFLLDLAQSARCGRSCCLLEPFFGLQSLSDHDCLWKPEHQDPGQALHIESRRTNGPHRQPCLAAVGLRNVVRFKLVTLLTPARASEAIRTW